jgi:hypothetical protein
VLLIHQAVNAMQSPSHFAPFKHSEINKVF